MAHIVIVESPTDPTSAAIATVVCVDAGHRATLLRPEQGLTPSRNGYPVDLLIADTQQPLAPITGWLAQCQDERPPILGLYYKAGPRQLERRALFEFDQLIAKPLRLGDLRAAIEDALRRPVTPAA